MGDMAVSNSIGSNVFDILVGLGLPWALKTLAINYGSDVSSTKLIDPLIMVVHRALQTFIRKLSFFYFQLSISSTICGTNSLCAAHFVLLLVLERVKMNLYNEVNLSLLLVLLI